MVEVKASYVGCAHGHVGVKSVSGEDVEGGKRVEMTVAALSPDIWDCWLE